MAKVTYLTQEGYDKLRAELDHLISVERPSISAQIAEAEIKETCPKMQNTMLPKMHKASWNLKYLNCKKPCVMPVCLVKTS